MKIRNGFVSNSSSQSFVIVANGTLNSVFDVARYMLSARDFGNEQRLIDLLDRSGGFDPDIPVAFRSCNYDTFIIRVDDYFIIDTCWNHSWNFGDAATTLSWTVVPEYIKEMLFPSGGSQRTPFYFEDLNLGQKVHEFWLLDNDIFGRPLKPTESENSFCSDCGSEYWEVNGEVVCPHCSSKYANEVFEEIEE